MKSKSIKYRGDITTFGKTDYKIPTFSFKSSLVIILGGVVATFIIPFLLSKIGIDFKVSAVIGNGVITSFSLAYARYFIESKKGFCKNFWITYGGFALVFSLIAFFWLYLEAYI